MLKGVSIVNRKTIETHIQKLNNEDTVSQSFYARNSVHYTLVSYVNNSIACFMSGNHTGTILFVYRAYNEMASKNKAYSNHLQYFMLCQQYLRDVTSFLVSNQFIDEFFLEKVKEMDFDSLL